MLQPANGSQPPLRVSPRLAVGHETSLPIHPWAPRALALIDQPVMIVRLGDLSLFWVNDAAERNLLAVAAGHTPRPADLLPELEAWSTDSGQSPLPPGFRMSWSTELPAGRRETDVASPAMVTLEVLEGEPEGLAVIVIAPCSQPASVGTARSQENLDRAALDPLTGLPDRVYFTERLRQSLEKYSHGGAPLAVAFIDIDHFKQVNDLQGHLAGDDALRALADCLRRSLRPGDLVARYAGDEFVVLVHGVSSLRQGRGVARRFHLAMAADRARLLTTASLGLAVVNSAQATPRAVLEAADVAMYQAKRRGHSGHTSVRLLTTG